MADAEVIMLRLISGRGVCFAHHAGRGGEGNHSAQRYLSFEFSDAAGGKRDGRLGRLGGGELVFLLHSSLRLNFCYQ